MIINKEKGLTLYMQVAEDLILNIRSEKWRCGERIPTEYELCDIYHVSRITIRRAIEELVRDGLLYRKRAKGTFVQEENTHHNEHYTMIRGFTKELQELGKNAQTVDAKIDLIHANKQLAKNLNIKVGDIVFVLKRLRGDESNVFTYHITYIKYDKKYSLDVKDYYGSLYTYLRQKGIYPNKVKEYIEAILPNKELREKLHIKKNEPVLKRIRFTSEKGTNFYEYTECFYIGSKYQYCLDLS